MSAVSLKAHFDGTSIQLDEPYDLPRDAKLIVTVLSPTSLDAERVAWAELSSRGLAAAYGDDEPEYSIADVKS